MSGQEASEMTEQAAKAAKRKARIAAAVAQQSAEATAELDAMRMVFIILHPLGEDAAKRIIRWTAERIGDFPSVRYYDDEVPF